MVQLPHSLKFGVSRSVDSETNIWCFTSAQIYRTAHTDFHYGKDKSDITELLPLTFGGLYSCESCVLYYVLLIHLPPTHSHTLICIYTGIYNPQRFFVSATF